MYKAVRSRLLPPCPMRSRPRTLVPESFGWGTSPGYALRASALAPIVKLSVVTRSHAAGSSPMPVMLSSNAALTAHSTSWGKNRSISCSIALICALNVAINSSMRTCTAGTTTGTCIRAWRWLRTCWRRSSSASRSAKRCCSLA